MQINIGNDIIETERIKLNFERFGDKFKNRIYTDSEIEYCESKGKNKYQSYAARFAAKEAIFKAISIKLVNKYSINWKDIEIINDSNGRPFAEVKNIDLKMNLDITMAHIEKYAMATALVIFE